MKTSYHSDHQPKCGVCRKHCKSFESLREHITGPLAKANCSIVFIERGCSLCLEILESANSLNKHKETCYVRAPAHPKMISFHDTVSQMETSTLDDGDYINIGCKAVALDCEMVGGGSNGSLDLCARVCLIDEDEKILFETYVLPQISVTNYRYEVTGITEEHLKGAMPLKDVQDKIWQILYNGESVWRFRLDGGKAKVLVGHGLERDLDCLRVNYPDHMLRYDIQSGIHDPYEDCVSAMRLYKRMRGQDHQVESTADTYPPEGFKTAFVPWKAS